MRATALRALGDADIIVYLADATERIPPPLQEAADLAAPPRAPVLVVMNKADALRPAERDELRDLVPDARFISALTGEGVEDLLSELGRSLPESPFLYPEDEISTAPVRFFVAELVRETALEQLDEEVPYSLACAVEEFREGSAPLYIRTVLYVERESQKRILIGSGGQRIRDIGRAARAKIEAFVGASVYLDLWVKVLPNWRRSDSALRRFGYRPHDHPSA
jgi:GTP-binding protein Era